jgi:predicted RNA binding protein YcfA (HicA-like mRNA interferase family)
VDSREIIKRLRREGWLLARVKGSHHQFVMPGQAGRRVTVPHPRKDIPIKTLRSIMKQAGWSEQL